MSVLTPAKLRALRLLADGPRYTAKMTAQISGEWHVGGRVAWCLVDDGLAERIGTRVAITDAGREAVMRADVHEELA
jgi:hypothetical protein